MIMNDLTHSRTYNNVFYGEENRPVSNKITVRHNRVGEQGNCQDWTNPFPKIVALNGDKATFFAGDIWDHENFREGKNHMGIVFEAVKIGDFYYADKVLADIRRG
jgi:hypothetical protein